MEVWLIDIRFSWAVWDDSWEKLREVWLLSYGMQKAKFNEFLTWVDNWWWLRYDDQILLIAMLKWVEEVEKLLNSLNHDEKIKLIKFLKRNYGWVLEYKDHPWITKIFTENFANDLAEILQLE